MKISRIYLILILLNILSHSTSAQVKIEGNLIVDTVIWSPIVYLSLIPDFDQMNTLTVEMIIDQAKIDTSGYFSFSTQYLPKDDQLFRIHISKQNDPAASLNIGGNDENHLFFIANRQSGILVRDTSTVDFIKSSDINGNPANRGIKEINQLVSYIDSAGFTGSSIKTDLIKNAVYEKLRLLADTCTNPLVALYAIYKSQYEKNYSNNQQYYNKFLKKWKNEKSTYFVEFRKKIPHKRNGYILIYLLIGCSFFILGFITKSGFKKQIEINKNVIKDLTNQERKIILMLKEGKSNKEISADLSIGLSTVKSHVYSIYSKLEIKSRKEIFNLDLDLDKVN